MFRVTRKDKDERVPTWRVKVLFKGPEIAQEVYFYDHARYEVKHFVPFSQCYNCFRFNHYQQHCKQRDPNCQACFLRHPRDECKGTITCSNCGGDHPPMERKCPARIRAYQIKEHMTIENLSLNETKIKYPILFSNRFSLLDQDVDTSFPNIASNRKNKQATTRLVVNNSQESARNLHATFSYAKVAKTNVNRQREEDNARRTREEHVEALAQPSYNAPNGSALTVSQKNKVSEYEKILTEVARKVTNYMVTQSLDAEHKHFLNDIRQNIHEKLINLDFNEIINNTDPPGPSLSI